MITFLFTILALFGQASEHIEVGEGAQAKVERHTTCSTHYAFYYEKLGTEPWRLVKVVETPTGNDDC